VELTTGGKEMAVKRGLGLGALAREKSCHHLDIERCLCACAERRGGRGHVESKVRRGRGLRD